jgi:AP2-associated kinase
MKKIFGGKASKSDGNGALVGKTVQVGQFHVKVETLLGQGGYAEIYQVKEVNTGQTYALKHLKLAGHPEHILEVQKEAKTMAKLKGHPNILRLHAASFAGPRNNETDGFFLLDFCPATLLEVMQTRNFQLSDRMVLHVFGCVCAAVSHMHTQNPPLAHRSVSRSSMYASSACHL